MRPLIIIPFYLLPFLNISSYSADFNKGLTATNNGDFATALKDWKPLAEQVDINAQFNLGQIYRRGLGESQDYKEAALCTYLLLNKDMQKHRLILG